jgi:predicted TPR repeat methyltransferase
MRGKRVMDFGCGTGLLSEKLSPLVSEIVSIDSSRKMIEQLEEKNLLNVWALSADMERSGPDSFPILQENFDLILACSVFSFLPDYPKTLSILANMLTPGGILVQWDWMLTDENREIGLDTRQVKSAYTKADLKALKLGQEFEMCTGHEKIPVLMGVAKRGVSA